MKISSFETRCLCKKLLSHLKEIEVHGMSIVASILYPELRGLSFVAADDPEELNKHVLALIRRLMNKFDSSNAGKRSEIQVVTSIVLGE